MTKNRFEQVDAAKKRAFAAPARPDDDQHFPVTDAQVDPVEDEVVTEALSNRLEPDHGDVVAIRGLDRCRRDAHSAEGIKGKCVRPVKLLTRARSSRTLAGFSSSERKEMTMKVAFCISLRLDGALS